jgi:hypothetical protein
MHYSSGSLTFTILAIGSSVIIVVLGVIVWLARFVGGMLEETGEDE